MTAAPAENRNTNSITAPLFAALAAAAVIAFFYFRGNDVGQLPTLVGNLGGGPLAGLEGMRDSVLGSVLAMLIGISWFGLGSFVGRIINLDRSESHSHVFRLARNAAIGAAIWSLIWFFLGITGLYLGVVAIVAVVVGLALATLSFSRVRAATAESRVPEKSAIFDKALLALIAAPLVLAFIAAIAPPTAKDTLLYHFGGNYIVSFYGKSIVRMI